MGHRGRQRNPLAGRNAPGETRRGKRGALSTTVSGMAAAAGVAPHVIRYYARIGLLEPGRDPFNNYKRFTERHLRRVLFIRQAKALGYTLDEASSNTAPTGVRHAPRCATSSAVALARTVFA